MYSKVISKKFELLTNQEVYQILDIRNDVFVIEQKIFYLDTDFKDQHCIHYFIMDDDQMISYLRLIPPNLKYQEYSIGRVATKKAYRRQGLAQKLVMQAMQDIKGQPVRISGQAYLKSYYEKMGFKVVKDLYLEENIPHYEMLHENK
jgi:ElaA protein